MPSNYWRAALVPLVRSLTAVELWREIVERPACGTRERRARASETPGAARDSSEISWFDERPKVFVLRTPRVRECCGLLAAEEDTLSKCRPTIDGQH